MSRTLGVEAAYEVDEDAANATPMIALQVAVGSALVGAIALLGAALFGPAVGLRAGLAAAFYPALIATSHDLGAETLCALLLAIALSAGLAWQRQPQLALAVTAGACFGLAGLAGEIALLAAGVLAAWWMREARSGARLRATLHAGVLLLTAGAVIAPWTERNLRELGAFVPVSTHGWFEAGHGNTFESDDWLQPRGPAHRDYRARYAAIHDELARADFARGWTLEHVRAAQPAWLPRKLLREGALLLGPDSRLLSRLATGAYGAVDPRLQRALLVASAAAWGALACFAALGVAAAPASLRRLALGLLAIPAGVHLLSSAAAPFRVPWLSLLFPFAVYAWSERDGLRARMPARAPWALAATLGFIFLVAFPYHARYGGSG
jgi:hypothetical protein